MHVTQNSGACHTKKRKKVYNLSSVFQLNGFNAKQAFMLNTTNLSAMWFTHTFILSIWTCFTWQKKHVTHNSDGLSHKKKERKKVYKLPGRETLQHP